MATVKDITARATTHAPSTPRSTFPCDFAHVLGRTSAERAERQAKRSASEMDDEEKALSALEFEPWSRDYSLIPTKEQWTKMSANILLNLRLALLLNSQSKGDLIKMIDDKDAESFISIVESIRDVEILLRDLSRIAGCAVGRLVVAGTAAAYHSE